MKISKLTLILLVYLIANIIAYAFLSSKAELKSLHYHPQVILPEILFISFSITGSSLFLLIRYAYRNSTIRNTLKSKVAFGAFVLIVIYYAWSIFEGLLQYSASQLNYSKISYMFLPYDPFRQVFSDSLLPPSLSHPFGTNFLGEDILARVLYAAPADAEISTVVVFFAIIVGGIVGILAGYYGGILDEILMRITDVFLAVPGLILVIAIAVVLKPSFTSAMIGLMVPWWATYARLFRSQTLVVKSMNYIDASKLMGYRNLRIIIKHVAHNVVDPVIAYSALDFGNVILTYSTLTFLGIGMQGPNFPTWGSMVSDGLNYIPEAWWYPLFPSIVILLVVSSFVILGDRLQDVIAGRIVY
ncbi:ABC transporter permease [Acidianus manzaensis]|uniref:Peptide ABC transporter permease n=1 Tax=Acidianus manzaensis TaxID=282676 RepID=A0A1W6JYN4_9CREN|nr:ABC transporter permease [Acidianus manzaensis]ARM75431.1 peptide ABC transporter permease [Acidianus manzaensis]